MHSDSSMGANSSDIESDTDSWHGPAFNGAGTKAGSKQSNFMNSLLKSAQQREKGHGHGQSQIASTFVDSSSIVSVLFQNLLEIARGMRCVVRVPKQPVEPTKWGMLCEAMAPIDKAISEAREESAEPWTYFDGFDFYATEMEARDTRFSDPLITRPNPVFDSNLAGGTFVERQVFVAKDGEKEKKEE